ncbi:hypothetical protein NHX12_000699 [Muraenolepis orangiensis]|uniref:Alkylated DNA repair protein AlkB homologue 8 N-terminal domain-containing protein n=1 Tax=Muraenolepis orangiensis TaxID=630683 RepID=A0A9Q0I3M8_9TELE|nr:hypothetical protein NHX12_000699 [Muraenolepis orangiensis]
MGLTVNTIKTEVVCQWSADIPSTPPAFTAAGEQLSVVPSFRYLGSILSEDNTIDNEVQNRIKQASAAFGRLRRRVFQNKNLHLRTKVCVYQAICITTLLYSCEAWVTYSRHIRALEQFHIRCLQRILGITWRDLVPHSEVLSKTNCRTIEATITQHQLRWLGHVVRMPSNRLPRRVLYGQLHHGRRSAGGQKKRYKDQLKTALKKCKVRPEALEEVAADVSQQVTPVVSGLLLSLLASSAVSPPSHPSPIHQGPLLSLSSPSVSASRPRFHPLISPLRSSISLRSHLPPSVSSGSRHVLFSY